MVRPLAQTLDDPEPMTSAPAMFCRRVLIGILALFAAPMLCAVDVLTFHNDNFRSGANTAETALTQINVNAVTFGQLAQIPVDDDVFAQPLYVSGASVSYMGSTITANVLIVATENDSVYCFDADTYTQYWAINLGIPAPRSQVIPTDTNYDIHIGITSTPVIDKSNGIVYVCGMTMDTPSVFSHTLWALHLTDGSIANSSVIAYNNPPSVFVPEKQGQRPALTLDQTNGRNNLYIAFASFSDGMVYCGYLFSYDADVSSLAQKAAFLTCPAAYTSSGQDGGGIWMSGCGPAIDSNGDILLVTGNGYTDAMGAPLPGNNYGEAIVRLDPDTLTVKDYFSPLDRASLNTYDQDLGVGGLVLLPPQPQGSSVANIVVHDSKEGKLYVEDRDHLGQYNGTTDNDIQAVPWFGGSLVKATPVTWLDPSGTLRVFGAAESANPIMSFTLNSSGALNYGPLTSTNLDGTTAVSLTQMAVSSNGNTAGTGILWTMSPTVGDAVHFFGPGILRAYNAETLQEIYNSGLKPARDTLGYQPKNCAPLVANGKVYCASLTNWTSGLSNMVYVYGLLPAPAGLTAAITSPAHDIDLGFEPATITITGAASSSNTLTSVSLLLGPISANNVVQTVASPANPCTFSYTMPNALAGTYVFTVLAGDSTGSFAVSPSITVTVHGHGSGSIQLDTYTHLNPGLTDLNALTTNALFPNSPAFTTFPNSAQGPSGNGVNYFGSRLVGYFYPPVSGTYTFWISSDDHSQLYLSTDATPANMKPIANVPGWTNPLVWNQFSNQVSAPIANLVAGQPYFIEALYQQGGGGYNLAVAMQPSGGAFEGPIIGAHLSPPTLPPTISPPGGSYSGPVTVTLSEPIPGQDVWYTTDVTMPAPSSGSSKSYLATGPFPVPGNATTTVNAVSVLVDSTTAPLTPSTFISAATSATFTTGVTPYGVAALPRLSASVLSAIIANPPVKLSDTGLFSTLSPLVPVAGVLPYNVIAPLWSDGASKERFIALPAGSQIAYDPLNEFTYPENTVMIKNFSLTINGVLTPLELRLLMLTGPNTGQGITYKWDPDGLDATLMGAGISGYPDGLPETEGNPYQQTWQYPSRAQCLECHTNNAGFVLGPKARQLNTSFPYPGPGGATDNELRTWNYLQLFSTNIGEDYSGVPTLSAITNPLPTDPVVIESQARSYLDSNCAQCHRLNGTTDTQWDARINTPLANQGIINGQLLNTYGILGAVVLYPHIQDASMIYLRISALGTGPPAQMPPLARNVVDPAAVGIIQSWINTRQANQPTITSLSANSGTVGRAVSFSGTFFTGNTSVTFFATPASYSVTSDGNLTATVPNGATTGPIVITSCGLAASSATFTVVPPPPVISSFTPLTGPVGTQVTITGSGLTGTSSVTFGSTAATNVTVVSDTSVTAKVGAGTALGGETITVTAPGGSTPSSSQFTVVLPLPVVSSFSPGSGPIGTVVTITGSGLTGTSSVTFGSTAATNVTVVSDTSVTAKVGAGTALGGETITVTAPGGSTPSSSQFTVVLPPPVISSFSPGSGPIGTVVTITGSGLTGTSSVTFGSTAATNVTVVSDTSVTAKVGAGTALGGETITVTAPGGSTPSSSQYTVVLPPPVVSSFSPGSGPIGTVVTITGSGLTGTSLVTFGSTAATNVTVVSDTSVTAQVGAGTALGGETITVTAPGGSTPSSSQFTVVLPPPVISSFSPGSGPIGTVVTITGSGLTGTSSVTFGSTAATNVTVVSDTSVTAQVGAGTALGGETITVTAPGGSTPSSTQFTVVLPPPVVSSFSPGSGPIGTVVTITGSGLTGTSSVTFGSTAATNVTVVSDTSVTAKVGAGTALGGETITVTAPGGGTPSSSQFTVVLPPPVVSSFSPGSGPIGTVVTITGSGLTGTSLVTFGSTAATNVTVVSDTSVTAKVGAGTALGGETITVTAPGGSTPSFSQFTVVLPPPVVSSFSPGSGPVGTLVTITGSGLTGTSAVTFGATAATNVTVISDTSITVNVGAGTALGGETITVTAPGGSTPSSSQFTVVLPPPIVSSFSPGSGPIGTVVTITGSGLTGTSSVTFGSTAATNVTVVSDTSVTAKVGAGTALGGETITVTAPGGSTPSSSQFTVVLPPPIVSSFSPGSGPIGTVVTITGSGLTGTSSVTFGSTAATNVTVVSDTSVTAKVGAGTALGGETITVTAPGGSTPSSSQFTVVLPPPVVSSFSPGSGPIGTVVTITGSGLTGTSSVTFGSTAATNVTVVSDTSVTAQIGAGTALGGETITVTAPGGSTPSTSQFTVVLPPPVISSFSPGSGPVGTLVTITGSGLTGTSAVTFGATAATNVTVISDTSITVNVGAGTALGGETITVTAPGGSTPSSSQFTVVLPPPIVSSFSPGSGPIGTVVTITGSGLTGTSSVTFGSTAATNVTVVSDTSVTAKVGAGTALGGETITVTAPGGSTPSSSQFTVVLPPPVVSSFSPGSGPIGTVVTITGSGLTGTSSVTFGSTAATNVTVVSDTSVTAQIGAGTALGGETITVTAPGGSTPSTSQFTVVLPPPVISSFSPGSGPVGTLVTITGSGLTGTSAVTFGATAATNVTVISDTSITVNVGAGTALGGETITVTAPGGSTPSSSQFTVVLPPPIVSSFSPGSGPIGTVVTITGSGLTGTSSVTFGSTAATNVTVVSDTSVTAKVGAGTALGGETITVTAPGGSTPSSSQFTVVLPPPVVSSFSPGSGPIGTVVTITGSGLTGTSSVTFGSTAATNVTVVSDTSVTAKVGAGTALGGETITVTAPGGSTPSSSQFTVVLPPPVVSSFSPGSGPVGTLVTITGSGLTGTSAVTFGATAATNVTVISDTSITVNVGAGTALGGETITVTAPGGSTPSSSQFTVVLPPPIVSSFSPGSGPIGTVVTITGSGLTGTSSVTFGSTAATNVTVVSDTSVTAQIGAGTALGGETITVTAPGGSTPSTSQFTVVLPPPVISSFSPGSGPVGTLVTITGSGLTGTSAVTFGATAATNVTVISDTSITVNVGVGTALGGETITVTAPGGSTPSSSQFTVVLPPPVISSFSPGSGPIGTVVTITGSGLTGTSAVTFGATAATNVTVISDTSITVNVGAGTAMGGETITVTAPGGSTPSSSQFTVVLPPPVVSSFSPGSGPVGTVVTITGSGLTGATAVMFGSLQASTFTVNSDTGITATVPVGATTGTISITTAGGTAIGTAFTVIPPPVITAVAPAQGDVGTAVAISGSGFSGATVVSFNGTDAAFTVISDSLVSTMVPVGATTGPMVVTAPGGSASSGFTVVAPGAPTITSISPAAGAPGAVVIITGTSLGGVSAVSFNGTYAIFTVNGAGTQISAIIPAGANSGPITVSSPQGDATSATTFTNTSPPSSSASSASSTTSTCGNGMGALIGLLLMTVVLRRLRLRDGT